MLRVDGDLGRMDAPPFGSGDLETALRGIMNGRQREEYDEFLETDFSFDVREIARFRVNAFRQNRGAAAVFRVIPSKVPTMEALGMGGVFEEISLKPRGLVVVTGPTGSGKSTTLAAMVDFVNERRAGHILTIEDPIEFVHPSKRCLVSQREVHRDTRGFNGALRAALREDPDVILIGEMRDLETIRLALTAAETGHLVFGTLHTVSAGKTVDRIVDVFPGARRTVGVSAGGDLADAAQARWRGPGGGPRDHALHAGDPEPDQGRQGGADGFSDPDRARGGHADPRWRIARPGGGRYRQQGSRAKEGANAGRFLIRRRALPQVPCGALKCKKLVGQPGRPGQAGRVHRRP